MIDTHCHLLPRLDDGPRDEREAIELARELHAQGVDRVLCTPHYSRLFPTVHAEAEARLAELRAALEAAGIPVETSLAAEVGPAFAASEPVEELTARSIGGRYLIVEVLPDSVAPALFTVAERLSGVGLRPIFGHPERARAVQRQPGLLDGLRSGGALIQVVAPSLLGRWGREVEAAAWRLVDTGRADLIASDAHGATRRRPHLRRAARMIEARLGRPVREELTIHRPRLVLDGAADTMAP